MNDNNDTDGRKIIDLKKHLEDKFFEEEQAVLEALLELFDSNDVVAETALMAVGVYLGMYGGDGRDKDWHEILDQFVQTGREIRDEALS